MRLRLWVVRSVLRVFVEFWDGYSIFFLSCRTLCSVPGQGLGKTPLSEAQGCRLFVIVQFRPADAPLSPEPGGDQCTGLCVVFYVSCVVFVLLCFFRLNTSSPSGAVGIDTFHSGYSSFPRLSPRLANGPREFFFA